MTSNSNMKKIPSAAPFFEREDIDEITDNVKNILQSKRLVLGPYTKQFESRFSEYVGTKYGIAVSSGTAALDIVLRYCNIQNSEVIVPTNTFIACPNTVLYAGGTPVFADMNPESFCIDIDDVIRKINSKTKAIMAVHLSGMPEPEINRLSELCKEKKIFLLEDCAHAHGGTINNQKVGSFGIGGCFSFFATKIISTGTGGMITTDDVKLKEFADALRHQGGVGGEGQIEYFDKFGYDWMMSEITAAVGLNQLSKLEKQLEKRISLAEQYRDELQSIDDVNLLPKYDNIRNVYWKFIVVLDKKINRDKVREILRKEYYIDAGILYPTLCHLQPVYRNLGHKEGECPKAEDVMKNQLTLPINPFMTSDEIHFVVDSLNKVIPRCTE